MAVIELYKSQLVTGVSQNNDEHIPALGKRVRILEFHGETPNTADCVVVVMWDIGGTEVPLWVIQGSNKMPEQTGFKTLREDADGIKKIGICLINNAAKSVYMSGFARIWVED